MAYSISPKPYSESLASLSENGLLASPEGTAIGSHSTDDFFDTLSIEKIRYMKNPVPLSPTVVEEGKELFLDFCSQCHGQGNGKGVLVKLKKFPPPPSFNKELKDLTSGEMFISISNGKNYMAQYKSMLTMEERWKIIHYLNSLQVNIFQ
jgi:mono/diheme cytochrome c family protein